MRDVKSEGYYEQMKGRGVRNSPDADLKAVRPDAKTKTRFVLIDAVGLSETKKNTSQPLERKKMISFDALIEQIAMGRRDADAISSLAGRLAALDRKLTEEDRSRIADVSGGETLPTASWTPSIPTRMRKRLHNDHVATLENEADQFAACSRHFLWRLHRADHRPAFPEDGPTTGGPLGEPSSVWIRRFPQSTPSFRTMAPLTATPLSAWLHRQG